MLLPLSFSSQYLSLIDRLININVLNDSLVLYVRENVHSQVFVPHIRLYIYLKERNMKRGSKISEATQAKSGLRHICINHALDLEMDLHIRTRESATASDGEAQVSLTNSRKPSVERFYEGRVTTTYFHSKPQGQGQRLAYNSNREDGMLEVGAAVPASIS